MTQTKAELLQTRHQGDIRLGDADSSHYVGFKAPATVGTSLVWTLPATDGTAGYYLKTDGSGNLGWSLDNSGVSLSGSTNNTIATVTGANALQGEANLTFDGSELKLPTGSGTQGLFFQASSGSNANIRGVGTNYGELGFFIGNGEKFRLDGTGRLLLGHTASIDQNAKIQAFTTSTDTFAGFKYGDNAAPNIIRLGKSRNASIGGNTIVADDDEIGRIGFVGADGSDFQDCAAVQCFVDGTPGAGTDMPGRLVFSTTADGSGSLTERMRIDRSGNVGIGDIDPDGNRLLIRAASTIGTIKGHIMLAGDSATNGEGPQIVFSESGSASENAGAYIGHTRAGSNSMGNLVFATRATAGDANTVPTVALTIDNLQNATFASAIYAPVKTVSALELDLRTGNYFIKTISGNSTFTFANPAASGTVTAFTLELTHSGGTVTWPSSVKWNADTAPTLTTGKTHLFMFVTDDGGTRYRGSALVDYVN